MDNKMHSAEKMHSAGQNAQCRTKCTVQNKIIQ